MNQAQALLERLAADGLTVATAESCTGGMIAAALTDVPGASRVFGCGVVSYSNEINEKVLGVDAAILATHGAVSAETAQAMLAGLLRLSQADLGVAVTGVAGPDGGTPEKPVGLVYLAAGSAGEQRVRRCLFAGDRAAVRRQTVETALAMLEEAREAANKA